MTRETSKEVYKQIKAEGLLSPLRMQVYEVVHNLGPLTNSECAAYMRCQKNLTSGRLTELRDLGVIREAGTKICSQSGRNVIAWESTNELPKDKELRLSDREIIAYLKEQRSALIRYIEVRLEMSGRNFGEIVEELEKIEGKAWEKKKEKIKRSRNT